jgi:hypothetical protein
MTSQAPCSICLEAVSNEATIACTHKFCFDCIRSWSATTNSCPLCKTEFNAITVVANQRKVR